MAKKEDSMRDLQPEDRIKKLKALETKRKKEIFEAQKVIKDSEKEISDRNKWKEKVPIPEFAQDDLANLSEDAKRILEAHRGVRIKETKEEELVKSIKSDLEQTVELEKVRLPQGANVEYGPPGSAGSGVAYGSMHDLSSKEILGVVENIYQAREERGYMLPGEKELVGKSLYEAEKRQEAIKEGNYAGSIDEAVAATSLIQKKAGQMYHAGKAGYHA
jgi:hypothetical protein